MGLMKHGRSMANVGTGAIWLLYLISLVASISALSNQCLHESLLLKANLACSRTSSDDLVYAIPAIYAPQSRTNSTTPDFWPWSYKPVCTEFIAGIGSELCIYTNRSFAGERGISIFTTPQIADEFASLPPFHNPSALEGINNPEGPWYAKSLPGRGIGLLAKANIEPGDRIMAYTPLLLIYQHHEMPIPLREKFLRLAIDQLPAASRETYLRLATVYGNSSVIVQDVIQTNAFEMQVGGQMHLAVFPETSRINHDCAPNSQYYLDPLRLTHYVHATRSILADEELTIAYSAPLDFVANRQKHLQESFHFTCGCARCLAGQAADTALAELKSIEASLADWTGVSTASTKLAERLIQLYRQEGLEGFLDTAYGYAALTYNAVGDDVQAKKYAQLAADTGMMKDGPDAPNVRIMRDLLNYPKRHWSWRRGMQL